MLEELIDSQLKVNFTPNTEGLNPLLSAWQKALGSLEGTINLPKEDIERLVRATKQWKETISGKVSPARVYIRLITPRNDDDIWE